MTLLLLLGFFLAACVFASAVTSAAVVWEVRTTGSDNSGGGFVEGASGVDRSQQDAAQASGTNLTVDATTNTDVTPDGHTPHADDIGNVIQITSGAGFTLGFYSIASIQSGKWRLNASPAATSTSGGTWALGGALASPGKACGAKIAGNDVHIKAGTYTITSTSSNVAGGVLDDTTGGVLSPYNPSRWIGYQTTRGDGGTKPVIQINSTGVTSVTMLKFNGGSMTTFENITFDGASKTSIRGIQYVGGSGHNVLKNCKIMNMTNFGLLDTANDRTIDCEFTGCSGSSAARISGHAIGCYSHDNTIHGFESLDGTFTRCVSESNSGASTDGFFANGATLRAYNCVAYGNGRAGFDLTGNTARSGLVVNCIAEGNTSYGFRTTATATNSYLVHCAGYNNTAGNYDAANAPTLINFVALTGSPFTNAASADFTLNSTAGAGASCRAVGFPTNITGITGTNYGDLGAMQHQDAGGGGARFFGGSMCGGFDC